MGGFGLSILLLTALGAAMAQNSSTATTSAASAPASSAASSGVASFTTPVAGGVLSDTSILPVPSQTQSVAAFSTATASSLAQFLPSYTYNLTSEPLSTRTGICNQTTAFCASARCTDPLGNVTTNFCNPTTMGWNCQCDKGTSRLQPVAVPVNSYDCQFRTSACLTACQNTNSTVRVNNVQNCQTACNYIIGSTCGTASQIIPEYQVNSYNDKPKYYPNTAQGGTAAGITTSSAVLLLIPGGIAAACVMLGSMVLLR